MKKLRDLSVSLTTPAEFAGISAYYLKVIKKHLADNPMLIIIVLIIQNSLDKLTESMSAIRINKLIAETAKLDEVRDNAFITFRNMISAFKKSDVADEKKAHDELWPVIEKLGTTLYAEGYLEQSGRLDTLFQEMKKPEKVAALNILGITGRLDKLVQSESDFKIVYNEKMELETSNDYPTLKEARKELTPLINDLLPTLRMVVRAAPEGSDLKWVDLMNEQTDLVMTQVAARKTRKENLVDGKDISTLKEKTTDVE